MSILDRIKNLNKELYHEIIGYREHIHANPELSFEEYNTADFIEERLKSFGLTPERTATTGIKCLIEGKNPDKKIVALRADIDALPIRESNDVSYKSKNEGVMHACGHDVHSSSLLGTAQILSEVTDEFEGTIKLIFQPGEEKLPGGASILIKEGVLKNPDARSIIGQHVMPLIDAGKVGFRKGMYMASADEIYVTVTGKGGHAAMPERNIDPVVIASNIIVSLQQLVSRTADPKIPTVLSFGKINSVGGATNVIPDVVKIEGTFRTLNEQWRTEAHGKMKRMAEGIADSLGASCNFNIVRGYPYLQNDPEVTDVAKNAAVEYLGKENVLDLDLWMAAEDFAYYSQEIPSSFYRLGIRNEDKGINSGLHTPTFDIDYKAMEISSGLMAWIALKQLES